MTPFQTDLLAWYDQNARPLPWRQTRDPYAVWVSEIMCQQTTIAAVLPFYERWMARFPTVESLALAPIDEVLAHWQGLGYYRRVRLLKAGAETIVQNNWPTSAKAWKAVPGVGDYTAGALASITLQEPAPLVDGNVERVYARLQADPASNPRLKANAWKWTAEVIVPHRPGDWNQALMELGALVCTPRNPDCKSCPVQTHCQALRTNQVTALPSPKPKKSFTLLEHHLAVPTHQGRLGIRQIPLGQWWEGMWEFPRESTLSELQNLLLAPLTHLGKFTHTVTQHKITVQVSTAELETPLKTLIWVNPPDLKNYALPTPARKALQLYERHQDQTPLF